MRLALLVRDHRKDAYRSDLVNGFQMKGKVIAQILAAEWTPPLSISADDVAPPNTADRVVVGAGLAAT